MSSQDLQSKVESNYAMCIFTCIYVFFFLFFFARGVLRGGGGAGGGGVGGSVCCSCFRGCLGSHQDEVDPNQVVFTLAFDSDQVGPYSINATSCELIKPDQVSASMNAI